MTFRQLTVKECFDNPRTAAVVKEYAPVARLFYTPVAHDILYRG